ncbi:MAG: hypothetical protein QUS12_08455 [Methanosarcina sp.]|nr:hypothetical protein [Methanosarcina sp.]
MEKNKLTTLKQLTSSVTEGVNEFGEKYQVIQLLPELKKRYPTELKKDILSVRFYQTEQACYIEITEDKNPDALNREPDEHIVGSYSGVDYITTRTSLAFIAGDILNDGEARCFFQPSVPILDNANSFLTDFDDNSMLNCTDLFSKEGADEIYNRLSDQNPS